MTGNTIMVLLFWHKSQNQNLDGDALLINTINIKYDPSDKVQMGHDEEGVSYTLDWNLLPLS